MSSQFSEAVRRFAAGGPVLAQAIQGLTPDELRAYPVPGTWTIHQIVVHLCDSDLVGTDRMKRVISEPHALLVNYDENLWLAQLGYDQIDVQQAAELFRLNRAYMASILERLPDDARERFGIHTQAGKKTLLELVTGYADHLDHHLAHLHRKRKLLGK